MIKRIIAKIKTLFHRGLNPEEQAILLLDSRTKGIGDHMIAMARLMFIKPETLSREAGNVKANAEYLEKMAETMKKP